jgi:hypothetical protein
MPLKTKYLFVVRMDVKPEKEDLFNEVYTEEHVPMLLSVPGFFLANRMEAVHLVVSIEGENHTTANEGEPKHTAIYGIESPDALVSDAWTKAAETGRWPTEVRPHTSNRRHSLQRITG